MLSNIVTFEKSTKTKEKIYDITLPWIEKYRPNKLKDLLLDDIIYTKINKIIKQKFIPNLLLVGPPGTGKTSTILCVTNTIFNEIEKKNNILELNASDDRGLLMINTKIIPFCKKKGYNDRDKIIILDEADNITQKAQYLLSNLINDYSHNTKFIFICNNYNNIIEAIQSKCFVINYNNINIKNLYYKTEEICKKENIKYNEESIKYLIMKSNYNIREIINNIECIYYSYNIVNKINIDKLLKISLNTYINDIIINTKNKKFKKVINITKKIINDGYLLNNFLILFKNIINDYDIVMEKKIKIINIINNYYIKINYEKESFIQFMGFISEFYLLYSNFV